MILFAVAVAIFASCSGGVDRRQNCINDIVYRTQLELSEKGYTYVGVGINSIPDNRWIDNLRICISTSDALDEETGRAMVVEVARELRDQINASSCGAEIFEHIPVAPENLGVVLASANFSEESSFLPNIQVVRLFRGRVTYLGQRGASSQGFDYRREETLGEALQKLGESQF